MMAGRSVAHLVDALVGWKVEMTVETMVEQMAV